jgi:hypothetical protein
VIAWAILAVVLVGVAGLITAAQPQTGAALPAPVSQAIARDCLAVFQHGNAQIMLPNGVTIQTATTQCTIGAPYGVLTVGDLISSGQLIGGQWAIQRRNGQYVLQAQISM